MIVKQVNPTYLEIQTKDLSDNQIDALRRKFTYESQAAKYALKRFKNAYWYRNKYGQEAFQQEIDRLKASVNVCLLEEAKNGNLRLLSGLRGALGEVDVRGEINYPEPKSIPWFNKPKFELRYYQKDAIQALLEVKHGAIELPTGSGKASVVLYLAKNLGLKTVVMVPAKQLAYQLYADFVYAFGAKYVGMFGDGKKKSDKLITIAIGASLVRIEKGTPHYENLSKSEVFIVDEAHTTPAETLSKVCCGLMENAPYRFFVSATQMRNDGKDMVLEGIVGPIVYRKTLPELVDEGFLAKPNHFVVSVPSYREFYSSDFLQMADAHFYNNPRVGETAARLANHFAGFGQKVLILLDQTVQFQYIFPHLTHQFGFAHGPTESEHIPERWKKSDVDGLVKEFNDGKLPILIGTSCISTGTDTKPVNTLIYLQAGNSEIKFRQSLGRGTRIVEGKTDFNFIDFDIDIPGIDNRRNPFKRHLDARVGYCDYSVKMLKGLPTG